MIGNKMKTLEEIKQTNQNGEYWALCENGATYEAYYNAEHKVMLFCIPAGLSVVGYFDR